MLLVPNHHVVVPAVDDLYFKMENKITTNEGTQRGATIIRVLNPWLKEVPVYSSVGSIYDIEIYSRQFRPYSGFRLINVGGYYTRYDPGVPFSEYRFDRHRKLNESGYWTGGYIRFTDEVTLPLKVIIENVRTPEPEVTKDPNKRGCVIRFDNVQHVDIYEKRFNPGRYADSRDFEGQPKPITSHPNDEYNYMIRRLVLDGLYCEPVVLTQPLWGYARLTMDRRGLLYVPYKNFQGTDAFTYTLMTQHGQIGQPRVITVDVYSSAPPVSHRLSTSHTTVYSGSNLAITLTTISVPPETEVPFTIVGTGIDYSDFNHVIATDVDSEINYYTLRGIFVTSLSDTGVNVCSATLPLNTYIDNERQDQTFMVYLDEYPEVNVSVTIKSVNYILQSNITDVFEGNVVNFRLQQLKRDPTEATVPNGLEVEYIIQPQSFGLLPEDFEPALSSYRGRFVMNNGSANVQYKISADEFTESYSWLPVTTKDNKIESFILKLYNGPISAKINIIDTSRAPEDMPAIVPTPEPVPWTITSNRNAVIGGINSININYIGYANQPAYSWYAVDPYTTTVFTGNGLTTTGSSYNIVTGVQTTNDTLVTGSFVLTTREVVSRQEFEIVIYTGPDSGEIKARSSTLSIFPYPAYGMQPDGSIECPPQLDGVELLEGGVVIDNIITVTASLTTVTPGLWGNNSEGYSADSDMARAVIHANVLAVGEKGRVRVSSLGLRSYFTGSLSNGIQSQNLYSPWCAIRLTLIEKLETAPGVPVVTPTPTPTPAVTNLVFELDFLQSSLLTNKVTNIVSGSYGSTVDYTSQAPGYITLDGTNDFIDLTVLPLANTTEVVTIELWANLATNFWISRSLRKGTMIFGWRLFSIYCRAIGSAGGSIGFNSGYEDLYGIGPSQVSGLQLENKWHHYVFVMRKNSPAISNKIYIDGQLQSLSTQIGTNSFTLSSANFNIVNNSANARISGWRYDNGYYRIPMKLAIFRIYDKELSAVETGRRYLDTRSRFQIVTTPTPTPSPTPTPTPTGTPPVVLGSYTVLVQPNVAFATGVEQFFILRMTIGQSILVSLAGAPPGARWVAYGSLGSNIGAAGTVAPNGSASVGFISFERRGTYDIDFSFSNFYGSITTYVNHLYQFVRLRVDVS